MNCPDCGAENLEGAAYCEDCGSKLTPGGAPTAVSSPPPPPEPAAAPEITASGMIKCGSCGAENPATEAYCEDCGAGLGGSSAAPAGDTEAAAESAPPPPAACAKLVLATGGKEFPINKDVITIGRRSPADGVYPDVDLTDHDPESYVSRRHAQVIKQNDQYIFEDVGSANGSFVNNVKATKGNQSVLKDNDQVRLGKTEMIFKE